MKPPVFPNTIKNYDRIVDGESDQSEESGNHCQTHFPLEDRKEPERHQDVVEDGNYRGRTIGPFEPESDVHQNADEGRQRHGYRLVAKLGSGYGPDGIRTYYFVGIPFGPKFIQALPYSRPAKINLRL